MGRRPRALGAVKIQGPIDPSPLERPSDAERHSVPQREMKRGGSWLPVASGNAEKILWNNMIWKYHETGTRFALKETQRHFGVNNEGEVHENDSEGLYIDRVDDR